MNAIDTDDGVSALMLACVEGHHEIVRLLLLHGADKDLLSHTGDTAHDFAEGQPLVQAALE